MAKEAKKVGRPEGRSKNTTGISFPLDLLARLKDYAKWTGQSISAVVTKAVTRYLDDPDPTDNKKE